MIIPDIAVSRQDVRNLHRAMQRAERDIGASPGGALRFAAWAVAEGAAKASGMSKPYRNYEQVPAKDSPDLRGTGKKRYLVKNEKTGKTRTIVAASVKELKTKRGVKIVNRGLSRTVWRRIQSRNGLGGVDSNIGSGAARNSRRLATIETSTNYLNPFIRITNRSTGAETALRGGVSALDGILSRSAKRMEKIIDHKVKNTIKKRGLA